MKIEEVKEGTKLYVPDKQKAQFGSSVTGGLATVDSIREMSDGTYVTTKETEKIKWHLETLLRNQAEYEKQYKGFDARHYDQEFERDNFIW